MRDWRRGFTTINSPRPPSWLHSPNLPGSIRHEPGTCFVGFLSRLSKTALQATGARVAWPASSPSAYSAMTEACLIWRSTPTSMAGRFTARTARARSINTSTIPASVQRAAGISLMRKAGSDIFLETAVVAWNQGINLFHVSDDRLSLGLEYTAKYNLWSGCLLASVRRSGPFERSLAPFVRQGSRRVFADHLAFGRALAEFSHEYLQTFRFPPVTTHRRHRDCCGSGAERRRSSRSRR